MRAGQGSNGFAPCSGLEIFLSQHMLLIRSFVNWVEITIEVLTCCSLVGLLGAIGLRLSFDELRAALARCRFTATLIVNFVAVPALAVLASGYFALRQEMAIGMILLAAAPFAPVVPIYARMACSDLALAAALTGIFPLFCTLLTPLAAKGALWGLGIGGAVMFNPLRSLGVLVATITLPLTAGILVRKYAPEFGLRWLRPLEILSEAVGAASLGFVTVTQVSFILNLGWRTWLAMGLISEVSLALGWWFGGLHRGERQVMALGSSNRNIALALLISVHSFRSTEIAAAVVGEGLLLIALGLLHVGWWRFVGDKLTASKREPPSAREME